jgi:DTW domain-containing protein YfiP
MLTAPPVKASSDRLAARQASRKALGKQGIDGNALFEAMASQSLEAKADARSLRCPRCWHDLAQRCICKHIPTIETQSQVKVLVVMHHKEYLCAGDDAKLLLAMLPPSQAELFVFGRSGDCERLSEELAIDPAHNLMLWPGEDALTTDDFVQMTPAFRDRDDAAAAPMPLLRVVVLDGTYRHALTMFRSLRKRLESTGVPMPPHVALHPKTLSVYHRAQHGYHEAMAASVAESKQPKAMRM